MNDLQENRSYNVVKSNDIIQKSRYNLSLQEQKIILYLISKIKPEDDDFRLYEFQIKEFCEVCGIKVISGGNYAMLKEVIKKLSDKSNWAIIKDEKGKECETLLRWIEKPFIYEKSGIIKIRLDKEMKPYLLKLKEKFTVYSLYFILAMKSKYSIRLYEILKSYQTLGQCEFTIENLKEILTAQTYSVFADFRVKVLNIATQEINDYSDILVSYELEKKGRKFHKIKFLITPKYKKDIEESIKTWKNIEKILNKNKN